MFEYIYRENFVYRIEPRAQYIIYDAVQCLTLCYIGNIIHSDIPFEWHDRKLKRVKLGYQFVLMAKTFYVIIYFM